MNGENILLDKVKEICSIPSDNALAVRLGVQRQAISKIRREEMHLSDERIAELCNMAKLDGPTWLTKIHAERAQTPAERAMWKTMLERLGGVAAAIVAVVVAHYHGSTEALLALAPAAITLDPVYIMRNY